MKNKVCVIGKFDAMHKGHIFLIKKAAAFARAKRLKTICVTFRKKEEYLRHPFLRVSFIKKAGVDEVKILNFSEKLKRTSKTAFINYLKKQGVKYIFCGTDFKFGRNASGGVNDLKKFFEVKETEFKTINKIKISSSFIKDLIKKGRLERAEKYLGFYASISGRVLKGSKLGREINYPTININPGKAVFYPGVYACVLKIKNNLYKGVCSAGPAPTVNKTKPLLEAFVFGEIPEIYGEFVSVFFIKRLREIQKFSSLRGLKAQIKKDILTAEKIFRKNKKNISKNLKKWYNENLI